MLLTQHAELAAGEVGRDPIGVERQDAKLGRRPAYEAADEQQILRLLRCQRLFQTPVGGSAERQPGSDLEARARARG